MSNNKYTQDNPNHGYLPEDEIYTKVLLDLGFNPDAPGLRETLKRSHRATLTAGLVARAFKVWQQDRISAQTKGTEAQNG